MISQQLLEELKIIIKDDYGKDLEMKEVTEIAESLVGYFDLLAKINHHIQNNVERRAENKGKIGKKQESTATLLKDKNRLS